MIAIDHVKRINKVEVVRVEGFAGGVTIVFVKDRNGKITESHRLPNKYIPPADWQELKKLVYAIFCEGDRKKEALKV